MENRKSARGPGRPVSSTTNDCSKTDGTSKI